MPWRRQPEVKSCAFCGALFATDFGATYCSGGCGSRAAVARGAREQVEDATPTVVGPRTDLYQGSCFLCGRVQAEYRLTPSGARLRSLLGLPPCSVCGGLVLLEEAPEHELTRVGLTLGHHHAVPRRALVFEL